MIAAPFARTKISHTSMSIEIGTFHWTTTAHRRNFATKVVVTSFSTD